MLKKYIATPIPTATELTTITAKIGPVSCSVPETFKLSGEIYTLVAKKGMAFHGTFGVVSVYTNNSTGSQIPEIAAKTERHPEWASILDTFAREANILQKLRHPNIIRLMGTYTPPDIAQQKIIFLEYLPQNLENMICKSESSPLPPQDVWDQISAALDYLHSKELIHGDINPNNILVTPTFTLKLCDFGASQTFDELKGTKLYWTGNFSYYHPELLAFSKAGYKGLTISDPATPKSILSVYPSEIDFWALACTLYELVTKEEVFPPLSEPKNVLDSLEHLICAQEKKPDTLAIISKELEAAVKTRLNHTTLFNHFLKIEIPILDTLP